MEERRVVDYFVVVGASDEQSQDEANSTHLKQSLCSDLPPITNLAIVFPTLGEKVPSGYNIVETTPTGKSVIQNQTIFHLYHFHFRFGSRFKSWKSEKSRSIFMLSTWT